MAPRTFWQSQDFPLHKLPSPKWYQCVKSGKSESVEFKYLDKRIPKRRRDSGGSESGDLAASPTPEPKTKPFAGTESQRKPYFITQFHWTTHEGVKDSVTRAQVLSALFILTDTTHYTLDRLQLLVDLRNHPLYKSRLRPKQRRWALEAARVLWEAGYPAWILCNYMGMALSHITIKHEAPGLPPPTFYTDRTVLPLRDPVVADMVRPDGAVSDRALRMVAFVRDNGAPTIPSRTRELVEEVDTFVAWAQSLLELDEGERAARIRLVPVHSMTRYRGERTRRKGIEEEMFGRAAAVLQAAPAVGVVS